jgi:hypothetical protein
MRDDLDEPPVRTKQDDLRAAAVVMARAIPSSILIRAHPTEWHGKRVSKILAKKPA